MNDITERKRAEDLRRQFTATLERRVTERTKELTDANQRLQAIMDSALVGILTLNERGIIELPIRPPCRSLVIRPRKWWAATSAG